ncbi:MAG: FtsX-like permease family protein, partial [Eubacteriales bacterium]
MNIGFFPKLALDGIRKNKKLYAPFLLTCVGMVAMYYIMLFLATTPTMEHVPGSESMQAMLKFGSYVLAIFSVLFLFYTHAFLTRRRMKEFGLYNILGMDKHNISRILFWEMGAVAVISLGAGLFVGIVLSKLAELCLVNILQGDVTYTLSVSPESIALTAIVFSVLFLLLLLNALRQVYFTNAITLFRSENLGEKPPKANWVFGLAGFLILSAAYCIAVTIRDPLTALSMFFVAVIMVILATYLLFVSGSVLLCRILQKNKKYYYQPNHFVSVASMTYRMKRNGAGLASICILSTMVLVMLSASACLYFGMEDSMHARYPRDIIVTTQMDSLEYWQNSSLDRLREATNGQMTAYRANPTNVLDYRFATLSGQLQNGELETDPSNITDLDLLTYSSVYQVYFVPLADYNRMMGTDETLAEDEVLLYGMRSDYTEDFFTIKNGTTFQVKRVLDDFFENGYAATEMIPSLFVVIPDEGESLQELFSLNGPSASSMLRLNWLYGMDLGADMKTDTQIELHRSVEKAVIAEESGQIWCMVESLAHERADFLGMYGSIFFLGILLSIVFLFATILIIYYKQVSEGYEDQSRFAIMQKVGMTKTDIRKSINSQMLTVFLLPFVTAVLHLAFAFPM